MKRKVYLFVIVFAIAFTILICNLDILVSMIPDEVPGKHYFKKFVFVVFVSLVAIVMVVTALVEWMIKIITKKRN